jgi:Rab-like protein 2
MSAVDDLPDPDLKIILLGDSAVGKSKLVERFLMDEYTPRQLSTYALTLFRKEVHLDGQGAAVTVDFWDTAGQESFNRMHPSYYYRAHCCVLVFDVTRKVTYQHLTDWYKELREYCPEVPCIVVANKIDVDYNVTRKEFKFASKHDLPFFFVSAADGTNVVKVFHSAVIAGQRFKEGGGDTIAEILKMIGDQERDSEEEKGPPLRAQDKREGVESAVSSMGEKGTDSSK